MCCVSLNYNGCSDSACVKITTTPCSYFYIPNSFTPNNDDLNDVFKPEIVGMKEYHFLISNRWGEKIFETTDLTEGWNGNYLDQECPQDVYVYKINFTDNTTNKQHLLYIGRVTLLILR